MAVVWFVARAGAARRAWSGIALALLVGLAGGGVLAAWAGARRTDSAYERLTEAVHHADLVVTAEGDPSTFDPSIATGGPGVAASGVVEGFGFAERRPDGALDPATLSALLAPVDTTAWHQLDRPLLVEGRLPAPDAPDEVVVPEALRAQGYPVGSEHDICLVDVADVYGASPALLDGTAPLDEQRAFADRICASRHLRVVGATRPGPDEVVLRADSEAELFVQGGPGLAASAHRPPVFSFVLVDLESGADPAPFVDMVLDRTPPEAGVSVQSSALRATVVDRTLEPYVRALSLFAAVAAIAAVGVLGPSVARWAGAEEADRSPLRAVGLRSHQIRAASALRGATLGVVAAVVAVALGLLASSHFPIGIGARIEPDPGWRFDGVVLAGGATVIILLSAVLGAVATTHGAAVVRHPSRVTEAMQAVGARPASVAGVSAALSGEGRAAGAARAAGGVAVALVAVVTALTYQAGLVRLLDTPARYGWAWDVLADRPDGVVPAEVIDGLDADPSVTGLSLGRRGVLLRDGAAVQMFSFSPVRGDVHPVIVEGRAPRGRGEIALGGQTLERLGASLGDDLSFRTSAGQPVHLTVVGQALLPIVSVGQDLSVGEGGLVDDAVLQGLPGAEVSLALVDLAAGRSAEDLRMSLGLPAVGPDGSPAFEGPSYTADLRGYDAVRGTPLLLAAVLALLGLGVLAHTVMSSGRRRARELAVLRCLGFTARGVRSTILWYALAVAGLCLLVAVPLGIGLGRVLWSSFAAEIGLVDDPVTPAVPVALVVGVTLGSAALLAALASRRAIHVCPAAVLRRE